MKTSGSEQVNLDPKVLFDICEASPRGVLIANGDGAIVHANKLLIQTMRINPDLELGKPLRRTRIFGDQRISDLMKLVDEGRSISFTNRLLKGDEEEFWKFTGHQFPGGFIMEAENITDEIVQQEIAELLGKKYEQQIEIAQRLQRDLFPSNFQKKHIEVQTYLIMADDLAGDFFSISDLSPNSIGVVIGDVVGKGIPASLMAMSIHTLFSQEARLMRSPSELLSLVNGMLHNRFKGDFWYATAFYARIVVTNLTVTYARAGHEFPLVYRAATGEVEELIGDGYPLGMFANSFYETKQVQLKNDDRMLLFTDGLPDAIDSSGERFGHERLFDFLRRNGSKSATEILECLKEELNQFCGEASCIDDIALAVFAVVPDRWTTWEIPPRSFEELIDSIFMELSENGFDEDTQWDIRLAIDECVINAQKHGNKFKSERPVHISYLINEKQAKFRIRDTGGGFDYDNLPDPTLGDNIMNEHGRGVFITRKVMDEVGFNETGNEITITKKNQGPKKSSENKVWTKPENPGV